MRDTPMSRPFRRGAILFASLALTACAAGNVSLSDRVAGRSRVQGDADSVRVMQADSRADAFPLAIGHCARFGRSAQFDSRTDGAYVFRCVKG